MDAEGDKSVPANLSCAAGDRIGAAPGGRRPLAEGVHSAGCGRTPLAEGVHSAGCGRRPLAEGVHSAELRGRFRGTTRAARRAPDERSELPESGDVKFTPRAAPAERRPSANSARGTAGNRGMRSRNEVEPK